MRKSILAGAALAVAAGAWAAAPYATGMWAEKAFKDNLEAFSAHPQVDLRLASYDRGWTRSRARTELTFHAPEESVTFGLRHRIQHGPTFSMPALARITTTPLIPEERAETVAFYFGDRPPLKTELRIGLTGAQHLTLSSPAFHGPVHSKPGTSLDWQGLSGEADISAGHDRVSLQLKAPGLKVSGSDGSMTFKGLAARTRMHKAAEHLWLGDSHIELDQLDLDVPNREQGGRIRVQVRTIRGEQTLADGQAEDLLRVTGGWGFQSARVDGREFSDGALALELHNVDKGAYRDLQKRARALQADDLSQEELAQRNLALFQELLPRFLARSPQLKITRLSLETGDGRLEGTADATYRGDPEATALPPAPAMLLQRVTAHGRLTMDKALLTTILRASAENKLAARKGVDPEQAREMAPRMAQMQMGMLQGMGVLEAKGDHYTVEASWEEGSVTVNGRPLGMGMGGGAGQAPVPGGGSGMP